MPSNEFINDVIKTYLNTNYKFDDTEDEEVRPEQQVESVLGKVSVEEEISRLHTQIPTVATKTYEEYEDDESPKYEKIRQTKKANSVLNNY
jgi:hypothetical protein